MYCVPVSPALRGAARSALLRPLLCSRRAALACLGGAQHFLVVLLGAAAALVALAVLIVTRSAAREAESAEAKLAEQVAELAEDQAQLVKDVLALTSRLAIGDHKVQALRKVYEDLGRGLIAKELGPRFGLRIMDGAVGPSRAEGEIHDPTSADPPAQWDYRMPVIVLGPPPAIPTAAKDFLVYGHSAYSRPLAPAQERHLTPKAVRGGGPPASAEEPPLILCHYMVIFEISMTWVARSLLARLERRLYISLDRARAQDLGINNILDVVAVIGIVAPNSFTKEVAKTVVAKSYPHLHAMMTAGRFVWLMKAAIDPLAGSPRTVASAPAVLARK
jgi:hypothetical protein